MYDNMQLKIPNTCLTLRPGNIIKIGRFSSIRWVVNYGWFQFDNNRAISGWYLINCNDNFAVKPLTDADIVDIYLIES